jgi:hypothetical protein
VRKIFFFLCTVALLITACSTPKTTPESTATLASTATSVSTTAPELTATPESSPTPDFSQPYAVVSAEKADFWFPFPSKEHGWTIVPFWEYCGCEVWGAWLVNYWTVYFKADHAYTVKLSCGDPNNQLYQEIPTSDMLKMCQVEIASVDPTSDGTPPPTEYKNVTFSEYNGGMLITLLDKPLVQELYEIRPQQVKFSTRFFIDLSEPKKFDTESWESNIDVIYK